MANSIGSAPFLFTTGCLARDLNTNELKVHRVLDVIPVHRLFYLTDLDLLPMKDAGSKRRLHISFLEDIVEQRANLTSFSPRERILFPSTTATFISKNITQSEKRAALSHKPL
jgi:hypothetical protein